MKNEDVNELEELCLSNVLDAGGDFAGIYKFTFPNGKIYIGQSISLKKRLKSYLVINKTIANNKTIDKKNSHYSRRVITAINKYSIENVSVEILDQFPKKNNKDKEELNSLITILNQLEVQYILDYDCLSPKGYNLNTGGDNYLLSDEGKLNLALAHTGKKMSEATLNNLKEKLTGVSKSKEHVDAISAGRSVAIVQLTKDGDFVKEWASGVIAERDGGFSRKAISLCVRGTTKSSGGFVWRIKEDYENGNRITPQSKKIYQYDIDGNLIKIHKSVNICSEELGFNAETLRVACRRGSISNGYRWEYGR